MSAAAISYPNAMREPRASSIGPILILMGFVLIASTILVIVVSANLALADRLPVSQNLPTAIPVPTPPTAEIQPVSSGTPAPSFGQTSDLSVVAVPVPTP